MSKEESINRPSSQRKKGWKNTLRKTRDIKDLRDNNEINQRKYRKTRRKILKKIIKKTFMILEKIIHFVKKKTWYPLFLSFFSYLSIVDHQHTFTTDHHINTASPISKSPLLVGKPNCHFLFPTTTIYPVSLPRWPNSHHYHLYCHSYFL